LVKLPVALSGGSRLNCAPLAGAMLSIIALITIPWKVSTIFGQPLDARGDRVDEIEAVRILQQFLFEDFQLREHAGKRRGLRLDYPIANLGSLVVKLVLFAI
jgi:hypothetical protein